MALVMNVTSIYMKSIDFSDELPAAEAPVDHAVLLVFQIKTYFFSWLISWYQFLVCLFLLYFELCACSIMFSQLVVVFSLEHVIGTGSVAPVQGLCNEVLKVACHTHYDVRFIGCQVLGRHHASAVEI